MSADNRLSTGTKLEKMSIRNKSKAHRGLITIAWLYGWHLYFQKNIRTFANRKAEMSFSR